MVAVRRVMVIGSDVASSALVRTLTGDGSAPGQIVGRAPWRAIDDDVSPIVGIDSSLGRPGAIVLGPDQLVRLAHEIGTPNETWTWIESRATQANQPIGAIVQHSEDVGSTLTVVGPRPWSPRQLSEWVIEHLNAIEDLVGPTDAEALSITETASLPPAAQPGMDRPHETIASVERELDEVRRRLTTELRDRRPDLFDGAGRPKKGALNQAVKQHTGKKKLSRADILGLLRKKSS